MHFLSASAVVIHYEEALYQVYGPLPFYLFYYSFNKHLKNASHLATWRQQRAPYTRNTLD